MILINFKPKNMIIVIWKESKIHKIHKNFGFGLLVANTIKIWRIPIHEMSKNWIHIYFRSGLPNIWNPIGKALDSIFVTYPKWK